MDKRLKLNEKVTIYGTGKDENLPKDCEKSVHPELAKKLIASGKATCKKEKE